MKRHIAQIALFVAVMAVVALASGCNRPMSSGPLPAPQAAQGTPQATAPSMSQVTPQSAPTTAPSTAPTTAPTAKPTTAPAAGPTTAPATLPTAVPTVKPTLAPAATGPVTHTVQQGEWLYNIARKYNISPYAIIQANPSVNPNRLYPGQVLTIPGSTPSPAPVPGTCGSPYTVQPGDTVYSIARKCGKTPFAIIAANNLPNPNFIFAGQKLQIP
jgi:LysM repeat protein